MLPSIIKFRGLVEDIWHKVSRVNLKWGEKLYFHYSRRKIIQENYQASSNWVLHNLKGIKNVLVDTCEKDNIPNPFVKGKAMAIPD
jgi:hypothetical protein